MKKYFVLAFVVLCGIAMVSGSFAYDEGIYPASKDQAVGSPDQSPRIYRFVRYAEMAASSRSLSAGEVVVWDCISDDGVTIGLIGTVASSTDAVAGVTVGTIQTAEANGTAGAQVGKRNWGYVQVYGVNTDCMLDGTVNILAGGAVKAMEASGDNTSYGMGAATTQPGAIFGFALDAVTTDATDNEVFIIRR